MLGQSLVSREGFFENDASLWRSDITESMKCQICSQRIGLVSTNDVSEEFDSFCS